MAEYTSLDELCKASLGCTACGLSKTRSQVVPGSGPESAQVMFIGEGPGYHEDQQGLPFVGPAGKLLDELIESIGMRRSDVYIANMVKCRPPGNRDPSPTEVETCKPWLDGQIDLIKPKVIVTLGRFSMSRFLPGESITRAHGKPSRVGDQIVLPIHHPAAALYQQSLRKTIAEDFQKIPDLLNESRPLPEPEQQPKQLDLF